jgi:hypothetical protein
VVEREIEHGSNGVIMHTSAFKTCRIHHNGDYDGDNIITNEDSTSKPIGTKVSVKIDFKDIVALYILYQDKRPKSVIFFDKESKITVSFADIKKLKQIARILKVKTVPDVVKERKCPFCVGRTGRVSATCEDCGGSGKL